MRFRFLHAADIHLGYAQYNLAARADDFARAYMKMIDHALENQVDFVLIAGDLFHHVRTDPFTLKQAMLGLSELRAANIPAIVIEGNHDTVYARKDLLSWLGLLGQEGLLTLLNVDIAANGLKTMARFDPDERAGSWIDVGGARIYGVKYYGAATARILEDIHEDILPGPGGYTILMMHAGMEGQVPHLHGGLTTGQLEPLRGRVDYLALGHIHKRLEGEGGWIYNPGSTETNSTEEFEWPHGFFDVTVDTTQTPKHTVRPIQTPTLRPFRRILVPCEDDSSLQAFVTRAEERIASADHIPERAVIELHLGGVAAFRRQDVPVELLKGAVESRFSPLVVRVRNNLSPPNVFTVRNQERLSRTELERQVVERLIYQQADYRDRAAEWARLILDVKNMAIEKDIEASIADHVSTTLKSMHEPAPQDTADIGRADDVVRDKQLVLEG